MPVVNKVVDFRTGMKPFHQKQSSKTLTEAIGYVGLLFFLRIITLEELKIVWQAIDPRRRISDLKLQER
jgi:hypothetical protein